MRGRTHAHILECENCKKKSAEGVFRECCVVWVEDNTKGPQMIIVTESRRQHILSWEYFFRGGVESRCVDSWRVFAHRYDEGR